MLKKYEDALAAYTAAIEINPNNPAAYINRSKAHDVLIIRIVERDGKKYQSINPEKDFEKALDDLQKAIELDPNNYIAYNNRGYVYLMYVQDTEWSWSTGKDIGYNPSELLYKALADFNKAIELDPNYSSAYNNRGVVYHRQGKYRLAIKDFTKAIELNPNYAVVYENRSQTYWKLGDKQKSKADDKKAKQLRQRRK